MERPRQGSDRSGRSRAPDRASAIRERAGRPRAARRARGGRPRSCRRRPRRDDHLHRRGIDRSRPQRPRRQDVREVRRGRRTRRSRRPSRCGGPSWSAPRRKSTANAYTTSRSGRSNPESGSACLSVVGVSSSSTQVRKCGIEIAPIAGIIPVEDAADRPEGKPHLHGRRPAEVAEVERGVDPPGHAAAPRCRFVLPPLGDDDGLGRELDLVRSDGIDRRAVAHVDAIVRVRTGAAARPMARTRPLIPACIGNSSRLPGRERSALRSRSGVPASSASVPRV